MNDDFTETIINFIESTTEVTEGVRRAVQQAIVRDVIRDTPVDTGLAVRNWQAQKDSVPTSIIPYSGDPEAAGASSSFEAIATCFGDDGTWYFVNNVHYIYYLEYGTSRTAAKAMARTAVKKAADDLRARYG